MSAPKKRTELTATEIDIIRLVSRGYTNEVIAGLLDVNVETLRRRVETIHVMIGTSAATSNGSHGGAGISRVRMVIWAYENGIATQEVIDHDDAPLDAPARSVRNSHIEHGSYPGWQRHKRAGEKPCEKCEAAKRGYDVGVRHGGREAARISAANRLADKAFAVCRALVYRRPLPLIREQAVAVIREADADLMADDVAKVA